MRRFGLSCEHIRLVRAQDWTGLLLAGCHLQAALKLAASPPRPRPRPPSRPRQ